MTTTDSDQTAEAVTAIEALLRWSSDTLSGLIGLAELLGYLEHGGPVPQVAPRILREVEHTAAQLWRLPGPLVELWALALDADLDESTPQDTGRGHLCNDRRAS